MLRDCDPDPDVPEEYETALVRVGAILGLRGEPLNPRAIARFAIRATYQALVLGQVREEARKTLRSCLSGLLRSGQGLPDVTTRAEILLELLLLYGDDETRGERGATQSVSMVDF